MIKSAANHIRWMLFPLFLVAAPGFARAAGFEDAVLRENPAPDYPAVEYANGQEGWVVFSYVVQTDGSVIDPIIEDSNGVEAFQAPARQVVLARHYTPARLNGLAVERSFTRQKISFQKPPGRYTVARKFQKQVTATNRLIDAGKIDEASAALASMAQGHHRNLYEDAWYWLVRANLMREKGDADGEAASLRRAIAYEGMYLPDTVYASALKRLYAEDSEAGRLADAYMVSDSLAVLRVDEKGIPEIIEHARESRANLAKTEFFSTPGRISGDGYWRHDLLRRRFSFLVESGELRDFELRCTARRAKFEISADAAWTIPDSWGDCTLYVRGADGSQFFVNEIL